jgi:hypothetical protein
MPAWAIPLSVWFLGERMNRRKMLGLALGMGGMALLLVQILHEAADPATASLVRAFRAAAGRTPLLCTPWLNRRGQLVRTVQDAKESWRDQGLDGVVAGPYIILRRADAQSAQPKYAELARRAFFGGL